jgi:hypothetical protein
MNNPFYFDSIVLTQSHGSNPLILKIDNFFFLRLGIFPISNSNLISHAFANHMGKGMTLFSSFNKSLEFENYEIKSKKLLNLVDQQIKKANLQSVALLFSGGKDSSLLAQLLVNHGVKVHAYYVLREREEIPGRGKTRYEKLATLHKICEKIQISSLTTVSGGVSPSNLLQAYGNKINISPAAAGLANLFLNTDISKHKFLCFAQGADTLSNAVHTQAKYYQNVNQVSYLELKDLFSNMFTSTFQRKYRFIGKKIIQDILELLSDSLHSLEGEEIQNISRLVGMHLVHTPLDSKFVYDIAKLNNMDIFNPFHTLEVEELYFQKVHQKIDNSYAQKIEIDYLLNYFSLQGLPFEKSGFKAEFYSEKGFPVSYYEYTKRILELLPDSNFK